MVRKADAGEILRFVDSKQLSWPKRTNTYPGPGWNRDYWNLKGLTWEHAQEVLDYEMTHLRQHAIHDDVFESEDADDLEDCLMGLDLGVASAVAALSAAGCIPVASCNGGVLGDAHHEKYP